MMIAARSPRWSDAAHTHIELLARFPWLSQEVPFCATASDSEPHGAALFARAIAGEFGPITEYSAPVIALPDAQREAVLQINAAFNAAASALTAGYPLAETLTWPDQKTEAMAWQADNNTATPYLDALALARGIDRVAYIQKTLAKVLAFKAASAQLVGKRQKAVDQIQAATTAAELEAIKW